MLAAGGVSQDSSHQARGNRDVGSHTTSDLSSDASTDGSNFSFKVTNAGLIGVFLNDHPDGVFIEFALLGTQPMLLDLSRNKVSSRDVQFFHLGIARYGNRLQPVAQ